MAQVSVIFSTYNGEATLPRVLEGYSRQNCGGLEWELVIVDNGSTDATAEIIRSYSDRLPVTQLDFSLPGKNRALNHALASIDLDADLYIVTDDDSVPAPDFLAAWARVATSTDLDGIYGGTVHPAFLNEPPAHVWDFRPHFREIFAENPGKADFRSEDIYGPNMAVPGWVLRAGAKFDERIGPNSADKNYPMGSETEFCRRIGQEFDLKATFVSDAVVEHLVKDHQTTMDFIKGRAFRHGRGSAMQQALARGRASVILSALRLPRAGMAGNQAEAIWDNEWRRGFRSQALSFVRWPDKTRFASASSAGRPALSPTLG